MKNGSRVEGTTSPIASKAPFEQRVLKSPEIEVTDQNKSIIGANDTQEKLSDRHESVKQTNLDGDIEHGEDKAEVDDDNNVGDYVVMMFMYVTV